MSMKTLNLLKDKAKHLSNCLPEGSVFSIDSSFDGYRLHFENGNGPISCCGYEPKKVVLAQFSAASTVLDGIHRSKCSEAQMENILGEFRDVIESRTETLEHEITMLANLAGTLMREVNAEKVKRLCEKVIAQAEAEEFLLEAEDA